MICNRAQLIVILEVQYDKSVDGSEAHEFERFVKSKEEKCRSNGG